MIPPFPRTVCACPTDVAFCTRWPGHLIPGDLAPLANAAAVAGLIVEPADLDAWLAPSSGAVVMTHQGTLARVPTLVPRRRPSGRCLFLDRDDRCRVHAAAPFGCAYFDAHLPTTVGDRRADWGLRRILESSAYRAHWTRLAARRGGPVHPPQIPDAYRDAPILPGVAAL
jgi:hypothetical protein